MEVVAQVGAEVDMEVVVEAVVMEEVEEAVVMEVVEEVENVHLIKFYTYL
jgi:hypothetical protein